MDLLETLDIRAVARCGIFLLTAVVIKLIVDYIFTKTSSPAPKSAAKSATPDGGLFEDSNVVEVTERNYYHVTYLEEVEKHVHVPFFFPRYSHSEMLARAGSFHEEVNKRRSCRFFASDPVPRDVIEQCVLAAGTAPSGAHTEPWQYVVVYNKEDKLAIREIVEDEEKVNYERRMGRKWLQDLAKVNTTYIKEYMSATDCVILVFKEPYHVREGVKRNNWYYEASVSISVGILLCALNNVGLVTVTSTPMNCGPAIRRLLGRPEHEKLAFLLPVGYPSQDATVPQLYRKSLDKICTFI